MNSDQPTTPPTPSLPKKIMLAALIVATLAVCYFSNLGAIGFVGPDEPRYAWIARDMAESGDWITPRLYGKPWFEKPPLYYWMAGASFKVFGVSEVTARLPSAICALLATLTLAWLAWRVYGQETASWLLLLLPTSIGMIGFSHAAATDMPFSATLTIAFVCGAVILGFTRDEKTPILPRTPWLALLLFGFFLGLSVLAKGPAGIILCGGGVFFWALFTKRWRDAFRLLHPLAILSFCVSALPWYILCAQRNPDFFRVFIIEHNFKRYLTPEFQHIQPFWYYLPVLLAMFFPWVAILVSTCIAFVQSLRQKEKFNDFITLVASFVLFCLVFFSASRSKLPGYILPAAPLVGLLLAKHCADLLAQKGPKLRWLPAGIGFTFLTFAILLRLFDSRIPSMTDSGPSTLIAELGAFLGGLTLLGLSFWRREATSLLASVIVLLILLTMGSGELRELDAGLSSRQAAREAGSFSGGARSQSVVTYRLRRDYTYSLQFYLREEIPEWTPADSGTKLIFTNYKGIQELRQLGVKCPSYIVFPPVMLCGDPIMAKLEKSK